MASFACRDIALSRSLKEFLKYLTLNLPHVILCHFSTQKCLYTTSAHLNHVLSSPKFTHMRFMVWRNLWTKKAGSEMCTTRGFAFRRENSEISNLAKFPTRVQVRPHINRVPRRLGVGVSIACVKYLILFCGCELLRFQV